MRCFSVVMTLGAMLLPVATAAIADECPVAAAAL